MTLTEFKIQQALGLITPDILREYCIDTTDLTLIQYLSEMLDRYWIPWLIINSNITFKVFTFLQFKRTREEPTTGAVRKIFVTGLNYIDYYNIPYKTPESPYLLW